MYRATIGPIEFEFLAAAVAEVPALAGARTLPLGGEEFEVQSDTGTAILVGDRRFRGQPGTLARVELWRPVSQPEAPLSYLVLIADAQDRQAESVGGEGSIHDLVDRLLLAAS